MGLTGGIGAGKSTVAKELVELGAVLVDADVIAREIVAPGSEGLAELVDAFGDDILLPDGSLDRPALAEKAFATDEARGVLNAITHPRVGRRTAELVEAAASDAILVQDIPLLVEGSMAPAFHLVAVVHAGEEERLRRLVELRGMPESDAMARIRAQATEEQRREVADVWLDNTGAPDAVVETVRQLWEQRLEPFERNLRTRTAVHADPVLVPAQSGWDQQAKRLVARLALASGGHAMRIDHVGSTAVAGLDAVDMLDLQVTVADLSAADALAEPLAAAGFPRIEQIDHDLPKPSYGAGGETDPAVWSMRLHGSADRGALPVWLCESMGGPGSSSPCSCATGCGPMRRQFRSTQKSSVQLLGRRPTRPIRCALRRCTARSRRRGSTGPIAGLGRGQSPAVGHSDCTSALVGGAEGRRGIPRSDIPFM